MSATPSRPLAALHYFATDRSMPVADFARAAAERGFDAVLLPEHTHIPVSTVAPYPGGGELPERYRRTLDPYVALAVVAAQTDLQIGTCISLVAQHDPIALAKTIATLDFMSGGRFSLGVGYGWNAPELANHGHAAGERRAIVRENVALMRALWQDTVAEFHGDHADLSPSWAWPKPAQRPSVPVLLGCRLTPSGYGEIVGWADGWIGYGSDLDQLAGQVAALRSRWADAGRTAAGPLIRPMLGIVDDDTLRRSFERFQSLGVDQVVLDLQAVEGDILAVLDRYTAALKTVLSSLFILVSHIDFLGQDALDPLGFLIVDRAGQCTGDLAVSDDRVGCRGATTTLRRPARERPTEFILI